MTGEVKSLVKNVGWFYRNNYNPDLRPNELFGVNLNNTRMILRVYSTSHYGTLVAVRRGDTTKHFRLDLESAPP